jgi:hypothetical protein
MKNTNTWSTSLLRLFTLLVFSIRCTKSEPLTPEQLILGEWRFTHFYLDTESVLVTGVPVNDEFPNWLPCRKDDYVVFRADSTGEQNEGASTCAPADPQARTFRWVMYKSGSDLIVKIGERFEILQLDEQYLKMRTEFADQISPNFVETIYLERR